MDSPQDSIEWYVQQLRNVVKQRLLIHMELPHSRTSDILHSALTNLDLMEIWMKDNNRLAFAKELGKLGSLRGALRKRPDESVELAKARRQLVVHAIVRLRALIMNDPPVAPFT